MMKAAAGFEVAMGGIPSFPLSPEQDTEDEEMLHNCQEMYF